MVKNTFYYVLHGHYYRNIFICFVYMCVCVCVLVYTLPLCNSRFKTTHVNPLALILKDTICNTNVKTPTENGVVGIKRLERGECV